MDSVARSQLRSEMQLLGQNLAQEELIRVRNVSGATIAKGAVVYITGANSNLPTIALARADAIGTALAVGVVTNAIDNSANGWVAVRGLIDTLDTSAFTAGAVLYLSTSSAGGYTTTPPRFPNYQVRIGIVVVSSSTAGIIYAIGPDFGERGVSAGTPIVATTGNVTTTETIIYQFTLPANLLEASSTYQINAHGQGQGAVSPTLLGRLRVGTAGTTSDTQVCASPAVAVATAAAGWALEARFTVRSIGSGGTCIGNLTVFGTGLGHSNQTATVAINTTVANVLSLSIVGGGTTPIFTANIAYAQQIR